MNNFIKKVISALLSVIMLLTTMSVSVFAADPISGTCGENLTWEFDTETGELSIDGTGAMYNYNYNNLPWVTYKGEIKTVTIGNSVTTIGESVFYGCTVLTSVTIGNSVTTIGNSAFYWCASLTSVKIGESVTTIGEHAFYQCYALGSITIPDSVTTIGNFAFASCTALTNVTIPDSVTTIGDRTFASCYILTSIEVDADNEYYSSDSFGVLYNKDKTELIQYPIGNERTSFTIPDSVTIIGDEAFDSANLTSVTIGSSVTTIGDKAFDYCDNLTSIEVNTDNEYYSSDSFGVLYNKDKTKLIKYPIGNERTEFTITDSVTTIGDNAFYDCDSLTSVTIGNSVTTIGNHVFAWCSELTKVTIPDSVTSIGDSAFYSCDKLTIVIIPDSVTTIGNEAFSDCDSLTSATIGNSVTKIGNRLFYNCDDLTSVIIPDSVTTIVLAAFRDCDSLADVYYNGTEEEWNEISIGSLNDALLNATIHYNYGKPSGTVGENINWSFNEETKALSITGSGEMTSLASAEDYGWYFFKDEIETVEFADGITSVANNALNGYPKLKEVYLGQTVEKIGSNTFENCPLLAVVASYALNFSAEKSSFGNNDERFVFIQNSLNTQASAYATEQGIRNIPVYYDGEKKVVKYNGELTVYPDLPYMFLSKFIKLNPDTEYLYFDKIVFHGVEPEIIDIEDLENDTQAKYLTFNKLYVSLKKIKDGSAEGVTFDAFLTLLENGDYDSFIFELVSEEGNQLLTIVEVIEQVFDQFITSALRVTSKIINFFRKIFK